MIKSHFFKKLLSTGTALLITFLAFSEEKVYCVSNAHFDTQWNWTVRTSIKEYLANTLRRNIWLLENYPDYLFNFEGGIKYAWMKEYYPEEYEKIKEYIKNGRWHVSGASWDANDTNIPSPESQLRNILYGQKYYMDEFGVKSDDIFLPDCFGFSYTLPSIASHAGLIGFSTQKLQWRNNPFYEDGSKVPFNIGLWKGIDGSVLMSCLNAGDYTRKFDGRPVTSNKDVMDLVEKSPNKNAFMYYGVGDRGGSPTIKSVISVTSPDNEIRVIPATSSQMFSDYLPFDKHPELPVYEGELLMDVHGTGCYTSQAAMKALNRKNETLADAAERISVMANYLTGHPYPKEELETEWKRFIWHQFHDDLTGTSIPEAYTFSWNDELIAQNKFLDLIDGAASAISKVLDTRVKGTPIMVYNPVAKERSESVTVEIPVNTQPLSVSVKDPQGKKLSAQINKVENGVASVTFNPQVPPLSVSVFDVQFSNKKESEKSSFIVTDKSIENNIYRITLDDNGDISSIFDKRNSKELVDGSFGLVLFDNNESYWWPAWEIHKSVLDQKPRNVDKNVKTSIENIGDASATLKISRSDGDSEFIQYLTLYNGGEDDRIDVDCVIDWHSPATLLKAQFNTTVNSAEATYDLGLGQVKRGNNTTTAYEVPAQYWADLSDDNYGVTILTDSKYGWDKPSDNQLRLTLLHTPSTGYEGFNYQSSQDLGHHRFKYSIIGHPGNLDSPSAVFAAEKMNNPLIAYILPKHKGHLGKEFSFIDISGKDYPLLKALKMAESGDKIVMRLYNISGEAQEKANLRFPADITSAQNLNGIEETVSPLEIQGNTLPVEIANFSIATYGLNLDSKESKQYKEILMDLPYNQLAFTKNHFTNDGDFNNQGLSYAQEIVPDTVKSNGIRFKISKDVNRNHVLVCKGDTINLPASNEERTLYLLASCKDNDTENINIRVNNRVVNLDVPSFRGKYGQWGWEGFSESSLREQPLAYVGTHTHSAEQGDIPYELNYIYRYQVEIPKDNVEIILPENDRVAIFALTVSENNIQEAKRVTDPRYVPGK
ncbi:MAG: alpha-mannosidase [Muribaculaceae bacterium]|nr:alpha-mannosidase [Muribaculaceae bacterium]